VLGTTSVGFDHLIMVIALSALPTLILSGIKKASNLRWL
jgi:Ca2+-transporting ATPase